MLKRGPAIFGSGYYKLKVPPPFLRSLFQIPKESWHTSTANLTTFKLKVKVKTLCLLHSGTKSHPQYVPWSSFYSILLLAFVDHLQWNWPCELFWNHPFEFQLCNSASNTNPPINAKNPITKNHRHHKYQHPNVKNINSDNQSTKHLKGQSASDLTLFYQGCNVT